MRRLLIVAVIVAALAGCTPADHPADAVPAAPQPAPKRGI